MGFLFILIYFVLIFIVLEIAVMLLIVTGLDNEIARFQAVSMLTSTGFTTKESELILRHPVRRKIGVFLILFGVFSLAVMISTLSNLLAQSFRVPQLTGVTLGFGAVLLAIKNKRIVNSLKRRFHKHLKQEFELHELPIEEVLYFTGSDLFTGISIGKGSAMAGRGLRDVCCPKEDINVLFVQRGDTKIRSGCLRLALQEGDILFVYGDKEAIERRFRGELAAMRQEEGNEKHVTEL
ncbi:TrkA C-terminal domain-containing protein [Paenibacillus tyrfis]|uniref:TrkA C-terminal domain-containing protein n=1 Tax=Paenibacillus tyrfis TaxID=1501230 RepID=UPI00209F5403|nr:TrkA C-terminal domain-containing protein [Paenibacillus tyrfis]MCP1312171.1 hypothetical protein [Paenibacillus tyrfis]